MDGLVKKTLELLIQAGALDCLKISRPKLCALVSDLVKYSDTYHQANQAGQGGLFDGAPSQDDGIGEGSWQLSAKESRPGAPDPEWLAKERKHLGVYLTGHPIDFHHHDRQLLARSTLADIDRLVGQRLTAIVIVAAMHERLTKTGRRMASFRLEDDKTFAEAIMFHSDDKPFPDEWPAAGTLVVVSGNVKKSFDGSRSFMLDRMEPLAEVREEHVGSVLLKLAPEDSHPSTDASAAAKSLVRDLAKHCREHAGDTPVKFAVTYGRAADQVTVTMRPAGLAVAVSDEFLYGLEALNLAELEIVYQRYRDDFLEDGPPEDVTENGTENASEDSTEDGLDINRSRGVRDIGREARSIAATDVTMGPSLEEVMNDEVPMPESEYG